MKPFLKWAGGKYRLLSFLKAHLPKSSRYFEPFLGSGAVFLNMDYAHNVLADNNPDLINLYRCLQQQGEVFIKDCQAFFVPAENQAARFYHWRDEFNTTQDHYLKAILFLYLNRHGFNGLCRYNRQGAYNVPFGSNKQPYFPAKEMNFFAEKLQTAELHCADYLTMLNKAKADDVIYCDPPYVPLSKTAYFTRYRGIQFDFVQQQALANAAQHAAQRGATIIISNHDLPSTRDLYQQAEIISVNVQRLISASGSKRVKVAELLAIYRSAQ